MKIEITRRQTLTDIKSISGIEFVSPFLYMVGDDAPYMLKTDLTLAQFTKISLLKDDDETPLAPMIKAEKPDFESMGVVHWQGKKQLLVYGSGSKKVRRRGLLIDLETQTISEISKKEDYSYLKTHAGLTAGAELNLEALCADHKFIYLFQRGNVNRHNGVLVCDLEELLSGDDLQQTEKRVFTIDSPDVEGLASGISGAEFLTRENKFLLTASVERTTNSYDDGEVLGSFIGVVGLDGLAPVWQRLTDAEGLPLLIKVESVTILETLENGYQLLLATDSDGGDSELVWLTLQF